MASRDNGSVDLFHGNCVILLEPLQGSRLERNACYNSAEHKLGICLPYDSHRLEFNVGMISSNEPPFMIHPYDSGR